MRKTMALLLALVLIVSTFAGCSAPKNENPGTDNFAKTNSGKTGGNIQSAVEGFAGDVAIFGGNNTTQYQVTEDWNTAKYDSIKENTFMAVKNDPLSTFSIDVDTASYANLRRMIRNGSNEIPTGAVRIEEIINYFKYDYSQPSGDSKFSVLTELSDTPWNEDTKLLRIGIQAMDIDYSKLPPSNLVFLLDISGSMDSPDRLPMVQAAMKLLVENLTENDVISIVVYAGMEGVVLEGVRGDKKEQIISVIDDLMVGGSTNGQSGLTKAYELALKYFVKGGTNRIIWCTDGDLNIGITDNSSIGKIAEDYAKKDVYLSIFGVGDNNYNDSLLKEASKKGKGNYHYLDSLLEARKALVDEMGGTLVTVAKDVKIQVDFNPVYVKGYRLIGYENRIMDAKDFEDDTKAAGVLGAGHRVTALYEIVLVDSKMDIQGVESRYQESGVIKPSSDLLTVAVRYKEPTGDKSNIVEQAVTMEEYKGTMSDDQKFTSAAIMWAMLLSQSEYKGTSTFNKIEDMLADCKLDDQKSDFYMLVKESAKLIK